MTNNTDKEEMQGINASPNKLHQWLEAALDSLISDESTWLSDLKSFVKNLTHKKSEKPLTKHNLRLIKEDLQDWWLIDFESWSRDGKQFWFEVIGNDIEPTLNFRYDSQRRTKLLVLHIEDVDWQNVYSIPDWDNEYPIEVWKESWIYSLHQDKKWFHMIVK